MPIRFSRLNDAQYCGLSASIETNSTDIFAMMGDAFHAANAAHYRPTIEQFAEERATAFGVIGVNGGRPSRACFTASGRAGRRPTTPASRSPSRSPAMASLRRTVPTR